MTRLSVDEFDRMVGTVERSLWRWEAQPAYHEPDEAEPFARWQAGEPDDLGWLAGWFDQIREATRAGRHYQRVRRLTEPLTSYLAWSMTIAPFNVAAGEDIRVLTETQAVQLDLPTYDFVIIDDQAVVRMEFGPKGFSGADLLDPTELVQHRRWRDLAWHHAMTVDAYRGARDQTR